jgi:exosortase A
MRVQITKELGVLAAPSAFHGQSTAHSTRAHAFWAALLLGVGVVLLMYWSTVASMVHQWETSSAYNYGFLVAPISVYLVWLQRHDVGMAAPARATLSRLLGVAVVSGFALAWLAADTLEINLGRHLALVGILQGVFLAMLGGGSYKKLAFAFNYLWLMVPAGEFLIRPLQVAAHAGSTLLLQASNIPVFTEGMLIEVPQGNFMVEEGCAGLNFFLSALALSLLYGKLIYRSMSTRLLCVAVGLIAAVAANIVRIYLIIALTEWSQQKIGLADDHLLFGWGFFAVVMFVLMYVGMKGQHAAPVGVSAHALAPRLSPHVLTFGAAAVVMAGLGAASAAVAASLAVISPMELVLPRDIGTWRMETAAPASWIPAAVPGDALAAATYTNGAGHKIDMAATRYNPQREGHEAAAAENGAAADGSGWAVARLTQQNVSIGARDVAAASATLEARSGRRQVFYWYEVGDCLTASRLQAKLCAARDKVSGRASPGVFVAVSSAENGDPGGAAAALTNFMANLPALLPAGAGSEKD